MLLLVSCHVAININIFICSGTWRGGCLCWTAWPPQQDAGQDALWEVNELRSFSVGSDISLAWRDLDHLQDFISSQYNMGHYWFLSSSRWSHQQLKLIIHDHQSSGSASPRSRSMTGWRCTVSILFSRRKKIVSLLRWGSEVEKIIEKGKGGGKAFFQKNVLKFLKLFPGDRARGAEQRPLHPQAWHSHSGQGRNIYWGANDQIFCDKYSNIF